MTRHTGSAPSRIGGLVPDAIGACAPPREVVPALGGAPERILAIDVLRGVALLGILVMNVQSFAMPRAAYVNPTAYGDLAGANWWVWVAGRALFDQKMYGILAMLFGAGIVLMTRRVEMRGAPVERLHYRRMTGLLLFGVLHAYLLWSGDILYAYAICGAVAFPFRHARPRTLFVAAGALLVLGAVVWSGFGLTMRWWPPAQVVSFEQDMWRPTAAQIAEELATFRGGWLAQLPTRAADAVAMQTYIFAFFVAPKTLGLMLLGMGLLATGVLTGERSSAFYRTMLGVAGAAGTALAVVGIREDVRHAWDVRYAFFLGDLWNYGGSAALSLAWVAAVMLALRSSLAGHVSALAAVGRTAISNYILQTALCTILFYGDGFGLFGRLARVEQIGVVLAVWGLQLALAPLWLRRFHYGPLEWVWRVITYGTSHPLRRVAAA